MAFIWNPNPTSPSRIMPVAVPPGEVTYQVHVIANSVDPKCSVTYNTDNVGFDELCQLPSANITSAYFTNAFFDNFTANTANISTATITLANIQTANILNANILYGYVGSDPTSNLGIASKHYVDAAMANVPTGGSDLQNIIDAKGDLLVGTGFHTATRLPIGSNGQILITDSTANTKLRWITIAGQELFYNLWIQTHYDRSGNDHQVILRSAGEIIMNDGTRTAGWLNKVVDIEVSGAGGLDVGVEEASRWYEVHAIRRSSNGDSNLLLHRASRIVLDQSLSTTSDVGVPTRKSSGSTATKVSQSFVPDSAGPLTSVEFEVSKTGSPTGLIWVTVESDDAGFPSGSILATSRVMDVSRLPTDKARMRFLFDTNTNVALSTTYHAVYQGDYTVSDANYTTIWGLTANGYASGYASEFRGSSWAPSSAFLNAEDLWFKTFVKSTPATEVTMPGGYDQRCLISYVYNDGNMRFKQYAQKNHTMVMSVSADWKCFTSLTGLVEVVDLGAFIPPVPCSVQFYSRLNIGGPKRNNPIGGVACTDLPITDTASGGQQTANTSALDTNTIVTFGQYGTIVLEEPVLLARMQNVDARLYVTMVLF
jgi:hypothetical protein